jgi:biofilm PGA synthesis N-glycosyltransferase PgaC
VLAWVIPILLAYLPGVVVGFLIFTLLITRYHEPDSAPPQGAWPDGQWPPVTIVIAAWNEQEAIVPTLERIASLAYRGPIEVVLADNNSTDHTAELAGAAATRLALRYRRVFEAEPGKHHALNAALATVTTPLVVTVDADTYLQRDALGFLIARITSRPQDQHVCACAGARIADAPTTNYTTRMQQWDYRLGINGVKRIQAAYNSALVAQGAFSAYWTDDLRAVGGWPDAIGEDIVLTWTMMQTRGLVHYEPLALAATVVPRRFGRLMSQRSRWARGMCEGLRTHPPQTQPRVLAKFVAGIDYLVPLPDIGIVFIWAATPSSSAGGQCCYSPSPC